jgi:hypothetical protein
MNREARPGLVAFFVHARRMKKGSFALSKMIKSNLYDVPRAYQARLGMADNAASLPPLDPLIHQVEVPAAVIDFVVVISSWLPSDQNGQVLSTGVPQPLLLFQ